MSKAKTKQVHYPIHKEGKFCGYDEFEDGSIKVAPMYASIMEEARTNQEAVRRLIETMTAECYKIEQTIAAQQKHFWDRVCDDYGLSRHDQLTYNFDSKTVSKTAVAEETKE